ncbi:polyprenyl synthetase family protein [bacterium]|nr:polyprenyl synthetase family protein [bacterium]
MKQYQPSSLRVEIDNALSQIDFSVEIDGSRKPLVEELIDATVLVGGKRMRPHLCLLFGAYIGVDPMELLDCAKSIEFVHSASLAHDDVIDEAKLRRSKKTLNEKTSNIHAVLAGDLLLTRATRGILKYQNNALLEDLSDTLDDLVTGEWLQLESRYRSDLSMKNIERIAYLKTGSVMRWCCLAPLRLFAADEVTIDLSLEWSRLIGLVFQAVDDCLDFEESSGKRFAQDYLEGQLNQVTHTLLQNNPSMRGEFEKHFGKNEPVFPWTAMELSQAMDEVRGVVAGRLSLANECLDAIDRHAQSRGWQTNPEARQELNVLMQALEKRTV